MGKKVFLGGTCNNSTWRNIFIPMLTIDYFNPVVEDWTTECQERELQERANCDACLYVITPEMTGVYSIAEVVDDSNKRPDKTVFVFINSENKKFTAQQEKSLQAVAVMVINNGGTFFSNLEDAAWYVNSI